MPIIARVLGKCNLLLLIKYKKNLVSKYKPNKVGYKKMADNDLPDNYTLFGDLLNSHLRKGTRPAQYQADYRFPWTNKMLAKAVGVSSQSVSAWRNYRARPLRITPILDALFGNDLKYAADRKEMESAYFSHFRTSNISESTDQPLQATRGELASVASPFPTLTSDERLDAGPNSTFDVPTVDSDLVTLPIRQRALIRTISADLPRNAPRHLKSCLENYDDELRVRGVQPILGLLKDMASIIDAAVGATSAEREWLEEGMREAFARFAENHALFVRHFPLDPKREDLYSRIYVDENLATREMIAEPFRKFNEATINAAEAGIATNDFLRIVEKMTEFASIISTQPAHVDSDSNIKEQTARDNGVTPKKRMILTGFGFMERAYNLLGSSVTLFNSPAGFAFYTSITISINGLLRFIGI